MRRDCNPCEDVTLDVQKIWGSLRPTWKTPYPNIQCMPACPAPSHPERTERTIAELDRVRRFASHFDRSHFNRVGRILDERPDVALYRTLAACNADPLFKRRKAVVP
jgi:hypothetical protein